MPLDRYLGNPLKRLERDNYALYTGERAVHWIDGRMVGDNHRYVPAMAPQLNLGVWLLHWADWAGPAPWETAEVRFAAVCDCRSVGCEDLVKSPESMLLIATT